MSNPSVQPAVALAEADALIRHLYGRCLLQAQAIADLQAELAARPAPPAAPDHPAAEEAPDV